MKRVVITVIDDFNVKVENRPSEDIAGEYGLVKPNERGDEGDEG